MTLSDAAWQKQGEDHPVLFTREIVTYKEKAESRISGSWQEGGAGRKKRKDVVCFYSFNKDLWGNVV